MKSFYEVSISDLTTQEEFKKAYATNNKKVIEKYLYTCGLDTKQYYEEIECTHRNRQGKIVTCIRFEGVERQDKTWMDSPYCTTENKVASCDFAAGELKAMNEQGYGRHYEKIAEKYVRSGPREILE